MATPLPLETQTLYAELLEHLIAVRAQRSIGLLNGTFTEKIIKGRSYLYWQASQPGGKTRQFRGRNGHSVRARESADGASSGTTARRQGPVDLVERAVVIDGGATLVTVPAPARFAFHKLLVATLRPAFQAKNLRRTSYKPPRSWNSCSGNAPGT